MSVTHILHRHFRRRVVGVISGAALIVAAVVSGAAPARASNDDLIRFLLGAATVAVIVHSFNDRDPDLAPGRRYGPNEVPGHCAETLRVRHRDMTVYNARCLSQAGVVNLPQRCLESVQTNRGSRDVYRGNCLERSGYRVAASPTDRPGRDGPARPHRPVAEVLPQYCALNYRQGGQRLRGYDGICLEQAGLRRLPQACAIQARGRLRGQTIYDADCLISVGYRRR
ncbi:hypothetical protein [Roseicitreum antarcticum]|uniref:Uncharacterized protein n=1 Tax=Roseicitreum antarcticum TaxID=564137 RepID=A0A1H2RSB7_9RHOB|nr:hypothetical protein [Roseicitreum antarcticum]SDW22175.1 hypothetical protein SAMN04488238_101403 [Roseicitreum antarcticum]